MEITNKTKKPLSIPLPAGKKLFLSPGKSGQITQKAAERPAVKKLVETGDIELSDEGARRESVSNSRAGSLSGISRDGRSGAMRQSGDK